VETEHRVEKEKHVQDTKDNDLFSFNTQLIGAIEQFGKGLGGDGGI
jgi:hypothetical protein